MNFYAFLGIVPFTNIPEETFLFTRQPDGPMIKNSISLIFLESFPKSSATYHDILSHLLWHVGPWSRLAAPVSQGQSSDAHGIVWTLVFVFVHWTHFISARSWCGELLEIWSSCWQAVGGRVLRETNTVCIWSWNNIQVCLKYCFLPP